MKTTDSPKKGMPGMDHKPAGEPFVWFTGMGLAIGMIMIIFLLGLIFTRGIVTFWPKDVVKITLKEGAQTGVMGKLSMGGEINRQQKKHVPRVLIDESEAGQAALAEAKALEAEAEYPMEWQLFVANHDVYGYSFKYIDAVEIAEVTEPENAIMIERFEFGDTIGTPVSLTLAGGTVTGADDPAFKDQLHELANASNDRRAEILELERKQIGRINAKLRGLQLEERRLEMAGKLTPEAMEELEARRAAYQKDFEIKAARARELRALQETDSLQVRLFTGEDRSIPFGNILHYYFPNQLGLAGKTSLFFRNMWTFVSTEPREANTEGGIFPAIFGTFVMTLLMSMAVTPFGVIAAIYLREYASQGVFVRAVRIAVNNLAGVPSIVFGVFGLGFFVYMVGGTVDSLFFETSLPSPTFGTGGIFWASLTLALMTVPVVIVSTEEGLAAVPRGVREASLACGASKWQTIQRIVLPASSSGILTGLILAMARGAGEVAPLMLVGVVKLAPTLPVDGEFPFVHLDRKFMHLGFHIYDLGFQSPDAEAAIPMVFATTLLLIVLVVMLNLTAILIRERLRRRYATAAF